MPIFRKIFTIENKNAQNILKCTALGVYDVEINGCHVEMGELNPGWTDYRKEVMCRSVDINEYLNEGKNIIHIQLSNGWWNGRINHGSYGDNTPLCVAAEITSDGTVITATDSTWQASVCGPLLLGDIYDGEIYDARNIPGNWGKVKAYTSEYPKIIPHHGPIVKTFEESRWLTPDSIVIYNGATATDTQYGKINALRCFKSADIVRLKKGETMLIDFSQNLAGIVSLKVEGNKGTEVTIRHGEMLNATGDPKNRLDDGPAGSLWTYNLRTAKATLKYILSGNNDGETIRPRHTYMGFRYIEIAATDDVSISSIHAIPIGSEIKEWGEFECSDPDINRLYANALWGQRSNFVGIPTDCPQRDERWGWTGDTQIFSRTALYNSDAADFYRKWMRDMRNGQREDGAFADIVPWCNFWDYGTSAWSDAGVIVPWNVFDLSGDSTIIRENYPNMTKWMDYLSTQYERTDSSEWKYIGGGTRAGDWLAYEKLDKRYVSMAYYKYVADLMSKIAMVLNIPDDAKKYSCLSDQIRSEFIARYISKNKIISETSQTALLLALHHRMLPDSLVTPTLHLLCNKIKDNGYKLSTGFVGTPILCPVLSDFGSDDLAYTLLMQRGNPSWLYSVDQGATTIWERWDSYTHDSGFHKHHWNMNSFNHYSYGAVVEWLYAYMCGIRPAKSGYEKLLLSPRVDNRDDKLLSLVGQNRIQWAKASTMTPKGKVTSEWKRRLDGSYEYHFYIPVDLAYDIDIPSLTEKDTVDVIYIDHHD